ncbi:helix-turn-helix domain-containing protein [Exiguobacterium acetylicum]|uniref:helix-turn-helix domain-containing protein n=1 Tax=Exiguobacterium acetylicum TaxID=41170 RepID=UPI001EE17337|nr:helix-turn-helix transcriptional regulator [Exiguobacterium acetylicum]UKS54903.1 helix-turn-helix transcriptional regulator [Exiguobacterium acetylicum]
MELMMMERRFRSERLRECRIKRGMQQDEMARHLKTNTSTMSRIENGKKQPDPEMIIMMAELFNVSTDYLLGLVEDPQSTHDEYLRDALKKYEFIGTFFSEDKLKELPQERLENIIKYMDEQYKLAKIEEK